MDVEERRRSALAEVRRQMAAAGLTNAAVAEAADLDAGTVGDFVSGKRWPRRTTLSAIERALGMTPGQIEDLVSTLPTAARSAAEGLQPTTTATQERDPLTLSPVELRAEIALLEQRRASVAAQRAEARTFAAYAQDQVANAERELDYVDMRLMQLRNLYVDRLEARRSGHALAAYEDPQPMADDPARDNDDSA